MRTRKVRPRAEQHHQDLLAAVVLMPPTLIASIYGMNFKHMPELDFEFGYPVAFLTALDQDVDIVIRNKPRSRAVARISWWRVETSFAFRAELPLLRHSGQVRIPTA
jgi:CorA-like Mg2+ transporter protein